MNREVASFVLVRYSHSHVQSYISVIGQGRSLVSVCPGARQSSVFGGVNGEIGEGS